MYFQLPIAGENHPRYRERVYCYELYHQLRLLLQSEPALADYALSGEIDKQRHPIVRHSSPDLVCHIPGYMANLAVVEVKPVTASMSGARKDLRTLDYFVCPAVGYHVGVWLVYGDSGKKIRTLQERFKDQNRPDVQMFWQRRSGEPAQRLA